MGRSCLLWIDGPYTQAWCRLASAAGTSAQTARRPSILFVIADDLNTNLGCYGHALVQSAHIDSLARRGVRFDRAYAQYPVCHPSRTSFLSCRYPETTGILDNRINPRTNPRTNLKGALFLPKYPSSQGYFTASIGKIYHDGMQGPNDWHVLLDPRPTSNIGRTGAGCNLTAKKILRTLSPLQIPRAPKVRPMTAMTSSPQPTPPPAIPSTKTESASSGKPTPTASASPTPSLAKCSSPSPTPPMRPTPSSFPSAITGFIRVNIIGLTRSRYSIGALAFRL